MKWRSNLLIAPERNFGIKRFEWGCCINSGMKRFGWACHTYFINTLLTIKLINIKSSVGIIKSYTQSTTTCTFAMQETVSTATSTCGSQTTTTKGTLSSQKAYEWVVCRERIWKRVQFWALILPCQNFKRKILDFWQRFYTFFTLHNKTFATVLDKRGLIKSSWPHRSCGWPLTVYCCSVKNGSALLPSLENNVVDRRLHAVDQSKWLHFKLTIVHFKNCFYYIYHAIMYVIIWGTYISRILLSFFARLVGVILMVPVKIEIKYELVLWWWWYWNLDVCQWCRWWRNHRQRYVVEKDWVFLFSIAYLFCKDDCGNSGNIWSS